MVYVVAYVKVRQGRGADVVAVAQPLIAAARKEKGCISYDLYRKPGFSDMLVFVETWKNRECLEAHFSQSHSAAFRRATAGLVLEDRIEVVHPDKVEVL